MNKILPLFLLTFNAYGAHLPVMTGGEVKINYPCGTESFISKNKEEKEIITFLEKGNNEFYKEGYILRKRVSDSSSDFTVKYRSKSSFSVNGDLYQELLASNEGELKCEYDFTYHPQAPSFGHSCSFKSETDVPVRGHHDFISMIGKEVEGGITPESMKKINIQATSWKAKLTPIEEQENPFTKKPSIEKWVVRGECRLEVSGKLSNLSPKSLEAGFRFIQRLVPKTPSPDQGSKTSWALGVTY